LLTVVLLVAANLQKTAVFPPVRPVYGAATQPRGSVPQVGGVGVEPTVIVSEGLTAVCGVGVELSVTVITNAAEVPVASGVPVIKPVLALRAAHVGSEPEVTAHVYGAVPPVARISGEDEYAVLIVPLGSEVVTTLRLPGAWAVIVREGLRAVCGVGVELSVTLKTKAADVPGEEGVPVIKPVLGL